MAKTDTIERVPRPRGELTEKQISELDAMRAVMEAWQKGYRELVVIALEEGGSFSEVSKATGLSTNTLQRWKREAGR